MKTQEQIDNEVALLNNEVLIRKERCCIRGNGKPF